MATGQVFDVTGPDDRRPPQSTVTAIPQVERTPASAPVPSARPLSVAPSEPIAQSPPVEVQSIDPKPKLAWREWPWRRIAVIALLLALLGSGIFLAIYFLGGGSRSGRQAEELSAVQQVQPQTINLTALNEQLEVAGEDQPKEVLTVNGELVVSGGIVLTAIDEPIDAVAGQLFYDDESNQLTFYDGEEFIALQNAGGGTSTTTNNSTINNSTIINNIINGGGVAGTPGAIAMFTGDNSIGDSGLRQNGSVLSTTGLSGINFSASVGAGAIQVNAGTGGLSFATSNVSGVSGGISITTGSSSTTASGNIAIDTGEGIIDGEVVGNKTFEGGVDGMGPWFGSTIAQSSAQAHTGVHSLAMTTTDPFWGVEQLIQQVTPATPGHLYYFSVWVRADSAPRTINGTVVWDGTGGQSVTFTPTVNSTTGWIEMTATAPAPATATGAYFRFSSSGAAVGEVHYFDDITVTDLSSSSAVSAITIGDDNAKIITIGNLNQVGATSIYGGSGINLNSGAAGLTMSSGVMTLTGTAASSFTTTTGALTLTSASAASWGVGTSQTGAGEALTLHGGAGAGGGNDGGDLILRGGAATGGDIDGGVIVWPQNDSTAAFTIQNSLSAPLFVANTLNSAITISGTTTAFASLMLENAHFTSTQTTAPTIATPTNCGTGPSAAVTPGSTDSAGSFTVTTGTGGTSSTCDVTINFDQPYGVAPKSIIVVGKTDAASAARQIYSLTADQNSFTTAFGVSTGGADGATYSFSYWIVE